MTASSKGGCYGGQLGGVIYKVRGRSCVFLFGILEGLHLKSSGKGQARALRYTSELLKVASFPKS